MSRLRRSWAVPVFWALGLMIIGAARAEPVTITFLHTNDVDEIAPKDGRGGRG
jgi:hypothetical protein